MAKFTLDQTTTIHFTTDQLMTIAIEALTEEGHDFSEDTIKPTLNTKGLTLAISKSTGKPEPKPRKKRAKKAVKESEEVTADKVIEEKEPVVAEQVAADNKNPFAPTSPDAAVAIIREENGVAAEASFPSDSDVPVATPPAINFDMLTD